MTVATTTKQILVAAASTLPILLGIASNAPAATIVADTTGPDNNSDPSFYGISFLDGAANSFIESISFDLSVDTDAFFDFDGDSNFGGASTPILDLASLVGLAETDISFSFGNFVDGDTNHPSLLTLNFATNAFGVGDSFRFAADTDFLASDPAPGTVFGTAGVPLSVLLEGGASGAANFVTVNDLSSQATVSIDDTPDNPSTSVPEPTAILGLLAVAALGMGSRLKQQR